MDVESVNRSPMLVWWERHTDDIVYFDELDDPYDYMLDNVHRGIMVFTENETIKERIRALDFGAIPKGGGLCVGDAMVFNEPLQCIYDDEVIWWCDADVVQSLAREFVRSYPYQEEYEVTKTLAPLSWQSWHDTFN